MHRRERGKRSGSSSVAQGWNPSAGLEAGYEDTSGGQDQSEHVAQCKLFSQEEAGEHGNLDEHGAANDARLDSGEVLQRAIPEGEGQGGVHEGQPGDDEPSGRAEGGRPCPATLTPNSKMPPIPVLMVVTTVGETALVRLIDDVREILLKTVTQP